MDEDEEILQRYGTPLDPLPEDEIPSKKPIAIEDQIVTDENGKRRFHGAFTGGFSAGFWNTVGSLEGWKPAEFKSSRSEKAPQRTQQRPEDFMDDEDLGEFGIAPQRIEAQKDFQVETANSTRKRKLYQSSIGKSGAIPGMPVLAELLRPVEDKIAVRILKSMGWKPGQGIGPRLTSKQKKRNRERNKREEYVLRKYACSDDEEEGTLNVGKTIPLDGSDGNADDDNDDSNDDNDELTFAPDDYESLVCTSKTNRFGLGYSGLSYDTSSSSSSKPAHFSLFGPLEVMDKNNKKLSIRGQAFGVGALEEEDEDIYARDDLTKYDFTLEEKKKPKPEKAQKHIQDRHIIEGFAPAKEDVQYQAPYLVEPPAGFQPRNWTMRKSRFAPLAPEKQREIEEAIAYKRAGLGRHDLNPDQRSAILEDQTAAMAADMTGTTNKRVVESIEKRSVEELQSEQRKRNERTKTLLERISAKSDNFTRGGIINTQGEEEGMGGMTEVKKAVEQDQQILLSKASEKTKSLGSTKVESGSFKPFLGNDAKQLRYEKFLEANLSDDAQIASFLATIQPVELSEWDREMERKEFVQARKIFKPLGGIMSERFVSETTLTEEKTEKEQKNTNHEGTKSDETKKIIMKRTKEMWKPHALLCKRYNIAEPFGGNLEETELKPAKRAKLSIFDYLETSVNRKDTFQTPVIIPKHIEKPKAIVNNRTSDSSSNSIPLEEQKDTKPSDENKGAKAPPPPPSQPVMVSRDVKHLKLPAKTELEKRVEESRDKPPSEKVELFRAIFEDSDDDEPEAESEKSEQQSTGPSLEIDKIGLPSTHTTPMSAAAANLLRNNSPPRGIFAALFTAKTVVAPQVAPVDDGARTTVPKVENAPPAPAKITFKSKSEREKAIIDEAECYGPKLPEHHFDSSKITTKSIVNDDNVEKRLLSLLEKNRSNSKKLQEVWVERSENDKDSEDSSSSSSSSSDSDQKRQKKKSKKNKKNVNKAREKKKSKKLRKKAKTKKKSKKKKNK